MRGQGFTGTLGGGGQNVLTSTRRKKDEPFGSGTPVPKPSNATRLGTSFMGSMARPQPRAGGTDPSFGSVNLSNGRQQFGRLGERAADQDITNYNAAAVDFNATSKAAKTAEISKYDRGISNYKGQIKKYDAAIDRFYQRQHLLNQADTQKYMGKLNAFHNGPVVNLSNPDKKPKSKYRTDRSTLAYLRGISHYYKNPYGRNYYYSVKNFPELLTGQFDPHNITDYPIVPTAPTTARPDPFVEQRQMKDALPSRIERQLAPGQREIVGGDLPPQVSDLSGDTFSSFNVQGQPGQIQGNPLSSFNVVQQQQLGAPKGYRVPQNYWTAHGQGQYYGGGDFSPSDVGNENSKSIYFKNYGWVLKSNIEMLY